VGLIARRLEADGIPTVSMSSAWSITRSVNPPRAAFLDFPLGHTAGKANLPGLQDEILRRSLQLFETVETPGHIEWLPFEWSDSDDWKDGVMRPESEGDNRSERNPVPQYQTPEDQALFQQQVALRGETDACPTCIDYE
jgi:hypothetical protein